MSTLPVIDLIATGQNIAKKRKHAGYSVRQMQKILGFSTPQAIYKWQRGESLPSIDNLAVLAAVLNVKWMISSFIRPRMPRPNHRRRRAEYIKSRKLPTIR